MKKILSLLLTICIISALLAGCKDNSESKILTTEAEIEQSVSNEDMFSDRDGKTDYDEASAVKIELNGTSVNASDGSVKISGTTVTITKEATHIISGTLNDGMIIVEAPDTAKLQLVLIGANITSKSSAPLYIKKADKVFVTLIGESTLSSGESFTSADDNNIDGAIFSKQDLTFNGNGSLTVSSPAGHGIVGKDDLVFAGGTYTITSASHGIQANDSVRIKASTVSADTGKDGIHCENADDPSKGFVYIESGAVKIESEGDGISSSSYVNIIDGTFDILAGGGYENGEKEHSDNFGQFGGGGGMHAGMFDGKSDGMPDGERPDKKPEGGGMKPNGVKPDDMPEMPAMSTETATDEDSSTSMKGIKSAGNMLLEGGTFTISSADDAIHSDTSATISGGIFEIASGDDAVHAEENLTVKGGKINISNSYEGLEALHVTVSGGDIALVASDDGLNAAGGTDSSGFGGRDEMFSGRPDGKMSSNSNGSIIISGGTLYINASGDGIDANGTLEITGGHTTVTGPTRGDTATLDYDKTATISGGTFIGTGASSMAQSFSDSEQGVIAVSVGNQSANTKITVKDKNGKEIVSYTPELSYQIIIISTPEMESGEVYTVTVGTVSEEFEAG